MEKIGLVRRFVKGVFEIKPVLLKYKEIWDIGKVLNYLKLISMTQELSLKQVTHKDVRFLALIMAQRC